MMVKCSASAIRATAARTPTAAANRCWLHGRCCWLLLRTSTVRSGVSDVVSDVAPL